MTDEIIPFDEIGQRLGVSPRTAYRAARRGDIPAIRLGRRVIVPRRRFERLLDGSLPPVGRAENPLAQPGG